MNAKLPSALSLSERSRSYLKNNNNEEKKSSPTPFSSRARNASSKASPRGWNHFLLLLPVKVRKKYSKVNLQILRGPLECSVDDKLVNRSMCAAGLADGHSCVLSSARFWHKTRNGFFKVRVGVWTLQVVFMLLGDFFHSISHRLGIVNYISWYCRFATCRKWN